MPEPEKISSIVQKVMQKIDKGGSIIIVRKHWKLFLGEQSGNHSIPAYIRRGKMTVFVDSSPWLQHLSIRKNEILQKVQELKLPDSVDEIRFKQGKVY